jgi:glutaredoxin 3
MRSVIVYTTDPCAYCRNAKALLERRGIAFEEINLARDPDGRVELANRTGMMTFPQIMIDGETIGGFNELVVADRAGLLAAMADE